MVASSLGGGLPSAGPTLSRGRQGHRAQSLNTSFWRVSLNGQRTQTCGGDRNGSTSARRAYTLTSDTAVAGSDARSADLNDMCTLQLGMLYQLLSRTGNNYSSMRCTVYARNFTSVGPGQVKLVRVAQFPVSPGQVDDMQSQQQLLLHTEQSWALQGGSAAVDPSAMIEDCLRHREVVALPSSSCLVFPLVDCAVLVGLLVVEMEADRDGRERSERLREGGQQHQAGPHAGGGAAAAAGGRVAVGPGGMAAAEGAWAVLQQQQSGDDEADGGGLAAERGACQVHARPRRSLTDEELQCLRLAVPLLAKACGMDARASWQLAQSSVSTAAAQGLLREAQRPLSTLNTFGAMLIPRLKEGDPDKDMAKGILVQGKRLQDLMWQLEDALHGPGAGSAAGAGVPQSSFPVAVPGMAATQHTALPASPFRSPSALPRDPSPAVQELLSLPPPRPAALPAAALQDQQQPLQPQQPSEAPVGGFTPQHGVQPPVSPGRVTFVDRSSDPASASPSDGVTPDAFTIRQPPGRQSPASTSGRIPGLVAAAGMRPGPSSPSHQHQHGASMATIDVEMDCDDSRKSSLALSERPRSGAPQSGARGTAWGTGPALVSGGAGGSQVAAAVSTNLASALAGVLTAAYRLAAVSGIGFIVNSPLSAVLPRRAAGGAATSKPRQHAAAEPPAAAASKRAGAPRVLQHDPHSASSPSAAAAGDGGSDSAAALALPGPRLIPRPARPLLVGVHGSLVARVVGYMLDIALQCTPRGGQVCVSARQDGAGVQVQVLHSGRMDLQRLHVRSRSMPVSTAHPLPAPSAALAHSHSAMAAAPAPAMPAAASSRVALAPAVAAVSSSAAGGGGGDAGSGVLSVELAQELAQQAGGHLTVSYPINMVNAASGSLDMGTSVEIWLPGP